MSCHPRPPVSRRVLVTVDGLVCVALLLPPVRPSQHNYNIKLGLALLLFPKLETHNSHSRKYLQITTRSLKYLRVGKYPHLPWLIYFLGN